MWWVGVWVQGGQYFLETAQGLNSPFTFLRHFGLGLGLRLVNISIIYFYSALYCTFKEDD